MSRDVVRDSGYLTLGSRFKRIGERMQADVQRISMVRGYELHGSLWTTLVALDREGELTVGELAQSLGIAQPGVTRNLRLLEARRLVQTRRCDADQRVRRVVLSAEGQALIDDAKSKIWPLVIDAVGEICGGLKGPLLTQLAAIEDALNEAPLDRRVAALAAKKGRKTA